MPYVMFVNFNALVDYLKYMWPKGDASFSLSDHKISDLVQQVSTKKGLGNAYVEKSKNLNITGSVGRIPESQDPWFVG